MAKKYRQYLQQLGINGDSIKEIDKLNELKLRAEYKQCLLFSEFINPEIRILVQNLWQSDNIVCFGGYDEAEYQMIAFNFSQKRDIDYPFTVLKIEYDSKFGNIKHRDILGTLMSLGLRRSTFGDIKVDDNKAYFFILNEFVEYIENNLTKIKNQGVRIKKSKVEDIKYDDSDFEACHLSLASLRADLVLAAAFKLSRTSASNKINSGLVKHNYIELKNKNKLLKVGDMLSLRGFGRFYLESIIGQSKKGKFRVVGRKTKK